MLTSKQENKEKQHKHVPTKRLGWWRRKPKYGPSESLIASPKLRELAERAKQL